LPHALVVPNQPYSLAHEIWIEKESLLSRLMRERLNDDSSEQPSPSGRRRSPRFQVATAPDGIIEAIETPLPLSRRPVAPGKLLAYRRVSRAV
jgi:gamma-glutamyl-gamma-aminobutyrate hydrolase PuuD